MVFCCYFADLPCQTLNITVVKQVKENNDDNKKNIKYFVIVSNHGTLASVLHLLYNKTRHSYIYMFPLAGQMAEPNGLTFFLGNPWVTWGDMGSTNSKICIFKDRIFFSICFKFHGQRRALQLVLNEYKRC